MAQGSASSPIFCVCPRYKHVNRMLWSKVLDDFYGGIKNLLPLILLNLLRILKLHKFVIHNFV